MLVLGIALIAELTKTQHGQNMISAIFVMTALQNCMNWNGMMSDYSHHIIQYLIWQCIKGGNKPAIRLEEV